MPVLGMGGLFFRSADPDALSAWYKDYLGVGAGCSADSSLGVDEWSWLTMGGPTIFAPFKAETDYFPPEKAFMINFRVAELDAMLAHLRAADIAIITKAEWDHPDVGRFARIHDPDGNAIELWEPPIPKEPSPPGEPS